MIVHFAKPRHAFHLFLFAVFAGMVILVQAAELTLGSRVQVSTNNVDFNLSVFPGSAGYEGDDESPVTSGTFGDGTVLDYRLYNSDQDNLFSYANGGAGLIPMAASSAANLGGAESWSDVWTTNDPGLNFDTTPNFATSVNTFARSANLSGTIDISGLVSGSIYIPHGTFVNQWNLSLTMSGQGQPDLVAADSQTSNGPSINYGWVTDFTFSDAAQYDTITYTYTNEDTDGSRARFMGVIIDGTAAPTGPPEVTNSGASNIAPGSAIIGGEVTETGGSNPDVTIYWGDNDAGITAGSWDHSVSLGAQSGEFSTNLSNLTPSTVYYFRCFVSNGAGNDCADSTATFSTGAPPIPPSIVNSPATGIGYIQADLNGMVTSTGGETPNVTIYFGDTDGGTNPGGWDDSVNIGAESGSFTTNVFSLTNNTTYYFRSFAQNSGGLAWAPSTTSFTTNAFFLPAVVISPASNVTGVAADISGIVTETGDDPPVVTIYYGGNDAGTNAAGWDHSVELGSQSGEFSTLLTELSSQTTYFYRAFAENAAGGVWAETSGMFTTLEISELLINEFMAANDGGESNNPNDWYPIANQVAGTSDDWIEILNTSSSELDLGGWSLTDDPSNLTKWIFPSPAIIAPGQFLIIYASGAGVPDANGNLHTNFKLSAGGEYLALANPVGGIASEYMTGGDDYPSQDDDISFGLHPGDSTEVYFASPTPGAANDASGLARVADTTFSPDRGYYQSAIDVTVASETPGAVIYYTTDGTPPVDESGNPTATALVYNGPIPITRTTPLRAAATKAGLAPTNIDAQTYILLDIDNAGPDGTDPGGLNTAFLQQTRPSGWGGGNYNMDTRVSKSTVAASGHATSTAQTMLLGMRDIPTVSIVMDRDDFAGSNGIYSNASNRSLQYPCSAEFIPIEGDVRDDWQINCGIKVFGGASRNRSPKHSLNLRFRAEYGAGKLREALFPGSEVEEFNSIAFRTGYNNSWIHWSADQRTRGSMIRDQWMRESMLDMGNPAAGHGFMVHMFINGLYWGVHNICERPESSHYAAHNGGDEDQLDARNASSTIDGTETAYNAMKSLISATGTPDYWEKVQGVLDINQYIDYQIINRYGGNSDLSAGNNWRSAGGGPFPAGQPELMAPWQIYSWDGERTLESESLSSSPTDPVGVRSALEGNAEYRVRFADRLKMHFSPGGALTPEASRARWKKYADQLDRAIIAESARWGDSSGTLYTRDVHWLNEQSRLYNNYFPVRSANVLSNYGSLLPSTISPEFLVNGSPRSGGIVPIGGTIQLSAGSGTIYYTTDGSDPRLEGGTINPLAGSVGAGSNRTSFITLEETGWRFLDSGVAQSDSEVVDGNGSYGANDWKHPDFDDSSWGEGQALLGYGIITGRTTNTILNLQSPRLPTIYLRKEFQVADAGSFTQIEVSLIRDDGAIVYLNGRELGRSNMGAGNQEYGDLALNATSNEGALVGLGIFNLNPGDLQEGANVLAVELHQSSSTSSDTGIDVQLSGIAPVDAGGSNVVLAGGAMLRARAFDNGVWSPISEARFIIAPIADSTNIVVSEIMYNPAGISEETEWVELMNIAADTIDLSDLALSGIDYRFPLGTTLAPGDRIVVVKNQVAFAAAYDTAGLNIAPGEFSTTALDNSGEELALIDALGLDARRFAFNDEVPWPIAPDGDGFSLVLIAPEGAPDHSDPLNWRASLFPGGSPGTSNGTRFSGDPNLDDDGDGLNTFLEYAFGSVLGDSGPSPEADPVVGSTLVDGGQGGSTEYATLTFRKNLMADDLKFEVEISGDLVSWSSLEMVLVSSVPNGDGSAEVTYRSSNPLESSVREFMRVKVVSVP